ASVSPNSNVAQDFTNAVTYTVTAEDGMSQNYSVTVTVAKNPAKAITSFNFGGLTPGVAGTINETNKTVSVAVPYGTDVTALVPTILHTGASVSPNSNVAQDFTNAVTYTVTAEDGMSQNYSVTVTVAKNPAKAITSFNFGGLTPGVAGTINETNKTVSVAVPYGTDVTALVPTILHTGASVSPNSNVAQDFTNAVTYTVTAEDGMSQNYSVTVTVAKNPAKAITSFNFGGLTPGVAGTINETNKTVSVAVPYGTDVTALVPTILHTGASVSPNSNVAQDFTNAVTYTVTAEDGTTQAYRVMVTVVEYSGSSQGSTKTDVNTSQITVDVKEGESDDVISQITVERATDSEGKKTDTVVYQEKEILETIEKLKESEKNVARVVIPDKKDEVTKTNVTIPSKSVNALADGAIDLNIETENASVYIPSSSLQTMQKNNMDNLYFNLVPMKQKEDKDVLTIRVKQELGNMNKIEENTISVLGRPVGIETNMPSAKVDIVLPLTGIDLPTDETKKEAFLKQLGVFVEHSDGTKEFVQGEIVTYKEGVLGIKFMITKFSTFTIVKMESKSSQSEVTKVMTPSKATIRSKTITATVSNKTNKLILKLTVSKNASWKLYKDKTCKKEVSNHKLKLSVGTNTYYVKVIAEDGTNKIYKLIIKRRSASRKVIIVATKYDFSDAVAGGVLASQLGGEVVRTGITDKDATKMVSYIKKNYKKTDRIYIIGLEKSINRNLEKILNKKGYKNIIKIGGRDKYETAAKIAEKIKRSKHPKVVLINGGVEPNNIEAIERVCGEKGYPILFVKKNELGDYTSQALKDILPEEIYIIGSKAKVSVAITKEIESIFNQPKGKITRTRTSKGIK
ncbi:MAG: DUF5018 domain-containing protein, partial [Velocimicrobium sp.]